MIWDALYNCQKKIQIEHFDIYDIFKIFTSRVAKQYQWNVMVNFSRAKVW